jgi:altronate dehydratase large subunit
MMEDNMDVDLSAVLRGERSIAQMGSELVDIVAEIVNGRMTKAEAFGFSDIAVDHVCRFV